MIIRDAYNGFIADLIKSNIKEPRLLCSILFCNVLSLDKALLFAHMDDEISDTDFMNISAKIAMLSDNVPVQYITGHQEFMSLDFQVTPDVLIPRQDTETLVEAVISLLKDKNTVCPHILELGAGSGCISVSLAHYIPNANIVSSDISESALSIAHENALNNNVSKRIDFMQGDMLLKSFYTDSLRNIIKQNGLFDIIVSNPPYIPSSDVENLDKNVRNYEPHLALDGGKDGLNFYTAIAEFAPSVLKDTGMIFVETGFDTAIPAAEIFKRFFINTQMIKDINAIDRVITSSIIF